MIDKSRGGEERDSWVPSKATRKEVLTTQPSNGPSCYEHVQLVATKSKNIIKTPKTYVQDIPLSPYAYHFQLMILFSHQYEDDKEIGLQIKQREEPETNYDKEEEHPPPKQKAELPEPPD